MTGFFLYKNIIGCFKQLVSGECFKINSRSFCHCFRRDFPSIWGLFEMISMSLSNQFKVSWGSPLNECVFQTLLPVTYKSKSRYSPLNTCAFKYSYSQSLFWCGNTTCVFCIFHAYDLYIHSYEIPEQKKPLKRIWIRNTHQQSHKKFFIFHTYSSLVELEWVNNFQLFIRESDTCNSMKFSIKHKIRRAFQRKLTDNQNN